MFRLWAILAFGLIPSVVFAESVSVATFNAEFLTRPMVHMKFGLPFRLKGAEKEEWDRPGFRDAKFEEATKAVAKMLAELDADVLALTEVGDERDVEELRQALGAEGKNYPHSAVCDCTDSTTRQHVAVLSRVPLSDVVHSLPGREGYYMELDDPESENDTGISKGMQAVLDTESGRITLFLVHLASERNGHEQDAQRIAQASIVRRLSIPLLNDGRHVIVAGDLNDKRGEPAILRIRGLDDIWPDLIQTGHYKYFTGDLAQRWTYEFRGVRQQIDHILLSGSIRTDFKIKAWTVGHGNRLASDHRPLIVELTPR